jgi:hypothetical protein
MLKIIAEEKSLPLWTYAKLEFNPLLLANTYGHDVCANPFRIREE